MAEERARTITELVADNDLMTEAIRQGVREELLSHARAGNPVPISENGQILWLSPEEIYRLLGDNPVGGTKPTVATTTN